MVVAYSRELGTALSRERAKNDAEKLYTGAEAKEGGRIEVTKKQIKEARLAMISARRESGDENDGYVANAMESNMLRQELDEEGILDGIKQLAETLPEGLKKDVETVSDAIEDGRITHKQGLEDLKRLLKPSFFENGKGPKGMVGKMLADARYTRLAELNDEEKEYWKQTDKSKK